MRILVALCFLAAVYTVHGNPLDILTQVLETLRNIIHDTISKLDRLLGNTEQETISRSMQSLSDQKIMLFQISDTVIKSIKDQTEVARTKGKNAQPCYDNVFNLVTDIKATAIESGNLCVDVVRSLIEKELAFINNLISVGLQLVTRLDNILMDCYSGNILQMLQCITIQLGETDQFLKNWLTEIDQADGTALSASNDVYKQGNIFLTNVFKAATDQITNATYVANECIKNA